MQRIFRPESKDMLIRISCAYAWYHYPEDVNFKTNLLMLLDNPASLTWLQQCKILQHMHNKYRAKLIKHYPTLFSDIDSFTLMITVFIADEEITELALAKLPHLRTQLEYRKILSVIPDKYLDGFKDQAKELLNPALDAETNDLSFCQNVPNEHASNPSKDTSFLNPITPNSALITVSAALFYYTQNYHYSVPVLWSLYSLYNFITNGLHATATQFERFLPFTSLFGAPLKSIPDKSEYNHPKLRY